MRTYNLFRRKQRAELVCAVPEDWPVPVFITGALWEFGGKLENADRDPFAFNYKAAEASVRMNGFYLFQITKPLAVSFHVQQRSGRRGTLRALKAPARAIPPEANRRRSDARQLSQTASVGGIELRAVNRAHRPLVEAPPLACSGDDHGCRSLSGNLVGDGA
jgi:hypothetical protein